MEIKGVMTKCLTIGDQEMVEEWENDACGTDLTMGRGYKISWNRSWSHSIHIWRLNMYLYKLDLQSIRL